MMENIYVHSPITSREVPFVSAFNPKSVGIKLRKW